jgi:hypothetical protein
MAVSATNSRLLRQVQSGRMEDVQQALLVRATKWMAAGCTEQANRILAPLFAAGEDLSHHRFYLVAFEIPWALTGKRPQHAPPPLQSPEDIERELWDHVFLFWSAAAAYRDAADAYMDKLRRVEPAQLAGNDLRLRAMDMAYDAGRPGRIADNQKLAAASAALDRYLASAKDPVTLLGRVLLAAQLGDVAGAREHLVKWAEHYRSYPRALAAARDAMFNFRNALMHRTVAAIALSGVLAPLFEITPSACEEEAGWLEKAFAERLSFGQRLAYGELGWDELLQRLSRAAVVENRSVEDAFGPITYAPATSTEFMRGAAAPEAMGAAEERLGLALPASYRGFLTVSNGLERYRFPGVAILPVEQLAWLRDAEPDLIEAYTSDGDLDDLAQKLGQSLLIGQHPRDSDRLLLVPADDATAEWECWYFAHWVPGEIRHRTFRHFIESELQHIE